MKRFETLNITDRVVLKNKVVVPPMASSTADENGFATEKTFEHYKRLSESRAGTIFVEYTFVDEAGKSEPNQLGVSKDQHIDGLQKVAQIIHESGALAVLQLTHSGGKSSRELTGGRLIGPSKTRVPAYENELELMEEMNEVEIKKWADCFIEGAVRAKAAGFEVVEIHSAHGYGMNQWLSSITNRRKDLYGGVLENRFRLLETMIIGIKKRTGLLISVRIPGQDLLEGGLSIDEMKWVTQKLESLDVNIINVSSGLGGWRRPRDRRGQGYLVPEASEIKKVTTLPVIGVGGIKEGRFIDELIDKNVIDLAAVGRAILEDPKTWGDKHLSA